MAGLRSDVPAPQTGPEARAFWEATRKHRFVLPWCAACGKTHWYPRAICPFCFGDRIEWRDACGRGQVYTFSVMRRAAEPYAIAYVALEEGPIMMTNLVNCEFERLRIGQPVQVVFQPTNDDGPPLVVFEPCGEPRQA